MRLFTLQTVVLFTSVLIVAPVPKDAKKAQPIDGTWEVVERHLNGERDDSKSAIHWTIDGESLVIEMQERNGTFRSVDGPTYRLVKPEGGKANELDYVLKHKEIELPPITLRGLYDIDGDTLKICVSHYSGLDRPIECRSAADRDFYLLKRVKDAKKDK